MPSGSNGQNVLLTRPRRARPRTQRAPSNPKAIEEAQDGAGTADKADSFAIVAIGASAGGLEAFTQLLRALPNDTGMAFVLIQHLDPKHHSMLAELLAKTASMPVLEAKNGTRIEPNHVYVIPPNVNMGILRERLQLTPRPSEPGPHAPVDFFMRSLAEARSNRAIGVVLSGTASDGSRGLGAIKAEGGITFAQDEKSAKYPGMPHSAFASGSVDFVLPPEKIAQELARISRHSYVSHDGTRAPTPQARSATTRDGSFQRIFGLLRGMCGINFAEYKSGTIQRRVLRRMAIHKTDEVGEYVKYLEKNPPELEHLCQDLLIPVTSFFRDLEVFAALKSKVFPAITKDKANKGIIRIWAPGCSTGEETYSLAILLLEFLGDKAPNFQIQLFGTDVNERGIERARAGVYPERIAQEVSADRLRRFFTKADDAYRVNKSVRNLCVFAKQNLAEDPPFSRMNLVACRNMLIYLGPELQRKIMPILHYALQPSGFLMMGSSESAAAFPNLFEPVDKKHKIFVKRTVAGRPHYDFAANRYPRETSSEPPAKAPGETPMVLDQQHEADRVVLRSYAPPGVVINEDMEILHFRGAIGPYVEPAPGRATLNLLKIAGKEFVGELRAAVNLARRTRAPVRRRLVEFRRNGQAKSVNISVEPLGSSIDSRQYLVLFERALPSAAVPRKMGGKSSAADRTAKGDIAAMQHRLTVAEENLRSIIESKEASDEEYQSANEEILSANEELQSTNEELETSKEELQSANEELNTVNDELHNRNLELDRVNSDLNNLLASTSLPVVMVDRGLRIRRMTSASAQVFKILPSDLGRAISDIRSDINVPNLGQLIAGVIDTLTPQDLEVQDTENHWYSLQIRPYRTTDDRIDGAVIILSDINDAKQASERLKTSKEFVEDILDTVRGPLLVLDEHLKVLYINPSFLKTFGTRREETEGRFLYRLGNEQWNIPALRAMLAEVISKDTPVRDFEVELNFPTLGTKAMLLNARRMEVAHSDEPSMLLALEDVTERKRAEDALRESEERHRVLFGAVPVAVFVCDRDALIRDYNRRAVELWGREPVRGVEKYCGSAELFLPDGSALPLDQAPMAVVLRTGEPAFNVEVFIGQPDGSRVPVLANFAPLKNARGEMTGAVCSFMDITQRKAAEEAVRAAAERVRFMAESMPQKIFTARPNGEVDYFNQQWMEFTGLAFEQIRDWEWRRFVHPDDLKENVRSWQHSIGTGEPFQFEHRIQRADRVYRWHLSRAHAMRDAEGKTIMWIGSSTDINDNKQAEQVLEERVEERTTAVRQLSLRLLNLQDEEHRKIARDLHDSVGQQLAAIKMDVDRLPKIESPGQQGEVIAKLSQCLDECISETRTISHLLHPPLIDELGLVSAVNWYVEGFSERSGIQANVDLPRDSKRLPHSLELPLFRVLQASLANVHRHSQSSSVDIRLTINAREARLEVKDHGHGIAPELLERFNLTGAGSGIGLAGMRERMRELGGRLDIESDKNGTVVLATLPITT